MKKISIIGTGSWGTALGWLLNNNGHQVCMWSPHPEKAEHLKKTRENPRLPGVKLPEEMEITADLEKAVREKDLLVLAVASPYIRETSRRMKEFVRKDQIVCLLYTSMREAIGQLSVRPQVLLNDAVTIPEVEILQVPIIKGDAKSVSIAAASIVAKVTRDRLMVQYHEILPEYDFAANKGYGSKAHIEALKAVGPSPIHRKSFIKNFI